VAKEKKAVSTSWRGIQQHKLKRVLTPQSRFKQLKIIGKWGLAVLLLCICMGLGWGIWRGYHGVSAWMAVVGPMRSLQAVSFETNGVLTRQWVESHWRFPWGKPLDQIDIFKLKALLEAQGQVRSATVTRQFPDTLGIVLEEACPIVKILIKNKAQKPIIYLVDARGELYQGVGYSSAVLEALPYLEGITLQKNKTGAFFPIVGFEGIAAFLDLIHVSYPALYQQMKSFDLRHWSPGQDEVGSLMLLKLRSGLVIQFAARNAAQQLDRLIYILNYLEDNAYAGALKIDLTFEDQAIVEFSKNPAMVIPKNPIRR
jgi:cell division septal protein FtsQ